MSAPSTGGVRKPNDEPESESESHSKEPQEVVKTCAERPSYRLGRYRFEPEVLTLLSHAGECPLYKDNHADCSCTTSALKSTSSTKWDTKNNLDKAGLKGKGANGGVENGLTSYNNSAHGAVNESDASDDDSLASAGPPTYATVFPNLPHGYESLLVDALIPADAVDFDGKHPYRHIFARASEKEKAMGRKAGEKFVSMNAPEQGPEMSAFIEKLKEDLKLLKLRTERLIRVANRSWAADQRAWRKRDQSIENPIVVDDEDEVVDVKEEEGGQDRE